MCGIAGRLGEPPLGPERWPRVLSALRHRGPDDAGLFHRAGIALAHTRLTIVDPSERGRQPLTDSTGRWTIVHNGEVYNYLEIRERLRKDGVPFRTDTDTEVILQAFVRWGEDCLHEFNGMFAFAIWDDREKRLFFARDRLGIKPFYYAATSGRFLFASEIKALLQMDLPPTEPNLAALAYFLQFRHNDLAETIFKGVFKLPPGHKGRWKSGALEIDGWWSPPAIEPSARNSSPEEIRELLLDSVRLRLRADFPAGLFLSGGVDSSSLLAAMARDRPAPSGIHTFTAEMSGLAAAGNIPRLAREFGNIQHGLAVGPDAAAHWPRIVWHYDELCADPASLPVYLLARRARDDVKIVLSGEGGDEIFAGYERAAILRWAWFAARTVGRRTLGVLPAVLRRIPPRLGNLFFRYFSIVAPEGIDRLATFLSALDAPRRAYLAVQAALMPEETVGLLLPEHARRLTIERLAEDLMRPWFTHAPGLASIADMLRFELTHRLPANLLLKCDAMTMAHGLECRVPYLDHRLVELALRVPVGDNLGLMTNKKLLRAAVAPLLPRAVRRMRKENFFVPIHQWLDVMRPWINEMLDEKKLRAEGIFDPVQVRRMVGQYRTGRLYYARPLWNLVHFQLWRRIYLENHGAMPL
jgi:asparagine synthase (glutamine-hydrolysing)